MAIFHSFDGWSYSCVCVCVCVCDICIHSSADGHLDRLRVLADANSAAVNTGVRVFFWITTFSAFMSRSGLLCHTVALVSVFWEACILFSITAALTYIPNWRRFIRRRSGHTHTRTMRKNRETEQGERPEETLTLLASSSLPSRTRRKYVSAVLAIQLFVVATLGG